MEAITINSAGYDWIKQAILTLTTIEEVGPARLAAWAEGTEESFYACGLPLLSIPRRLSLTGHPEELQMPGYGYTVETLLGE